MRSAYAYVDANAFTAPQLRERQIAEFLLVLQRLALRADFGLVERNACRREMGVNGPEFEDLVRRARQRGYIDTQLAYDRLSLTLRGQEKLAALYR